MCNSQVSPSRMYLKHLSHTQSFDCSLFPTPDEANSSAVRPCARNVGAEGPATAGEATRLSSAVSPRFRLEAGGCGG